MAAGFMKVEARGERRNPKTPTVAAGKLFSPIWLIRDEAA